jgi:L-2-hydroxyglutarate oxidase LhgO
MNLFDWIMAGVSGATYALGLYHGKKSKPVAVAEKVLTAASEQTTDPQAARSGTAAGAAANAASHLAGIKR